MGFQGRLGSESSRSHGVVTALVLGRGAHQTGGVPRQINNLATACLLQATARKVMRIDDALFQQAVGEFQLP